MATEFEKLILENKDSLLQSCLKYIDIQFPNRTTEIGKCKRDLSYILNSIITCVYDNNTADIYRIIHAFYKGGKLQLQSTTVEKATYNHLRHLIISILKENSLIEKYGKILNDIVDILILKIDEGYDASQFDYVDRRNYRIYKNEKIPTELIKRFDLVLQETPMQEPYDNKFIILKLSDRDTNIKEFYLSHLFKNDFGVHMVHMYTAPLVYMVLPTDHFMEHHTTLNIGIHGGALMAEVLRYGYNFSFVGCKIELNLERQKQSKKLLQERFNLDMSKYSPHPSLCFCIGRAVEETNDHLILEYIDEFRYTPLRPKDLRRKPPIIIG